MSHNYYPTFHKDNSITYWVESYGWFHRKHPAQIPTKVIAEWRAQDRKKWALAMIARGFVRKGNKWIPQHEIKNV